MSKLSEIYDSIKNYLHHGPSCAPFFEALVSAKEELESKLEEYGKRLKTLEDHFSSRFPAYTDAPEYISPPRPINQSARIGIAAVAAVSGPVPDDGASLTVSDDDAIREHLAAGGTMKMLNEADDAQLRAAYAAQGERTAEAPVQSFESTQTAVSPEATQPSPIQPDPAEPGITPDSVSLPAQPEPVSAGPDTAETPPADPSASVEQGA